MRFTPSGSTKNRGGCSKEGAGKSNSKQGDGDVKQSHALAKFSYPCV